MTAHVPPNHALADRLRRDIEGEVLFDRASRGRYATDASIYQIEPVGVVIPKTFTDVEATAAIAREAGVSLLARGGGTSQSGQTVGRSLVIDFSRHLTRVVSVDAAARTAVVEPGIVLDELNRQLKATGLWFPVDVSTSARATLGGMTANNSCGTRSLRYGIMRDNVLAIDALLADGSRARFGEVTADTIANLLPSPLRGGVGGGGGGGGQGQQQHALSQTLPLTPTLSPSPERWGEGDEALVRDLLALGRDNAAHIERAFPEVARRVGGYLIDALAPSNRPVNLATLLCGSEGTLAISERITLKLSPQPKQKALGICHFPTFRAAMEAAQHVVKLAPVAVEVVDSTLIGLARDIPLFRPVMETYVRGKPDALLLTEFAEDDQTENIRRLARLEELMGDLGHPNAVVKVTDAAGQKALWEVRAAGLNIMMSMKSEGKPVSFIEDCAVPLEHLADYTERLTAVFEKHGTRGTWYAHASVGCLHVRPVLNLKLEKDAKTMRAIAEEAFALVREYKGSHSGEHGDGLVRSEFHEAMYGRKTVEIFEAVKDRMDPKGLLNPGKIVRPPRMDDRSLFRFKPGYEVKAIKTALDWTHLGYSGAGGGLQGAIEMCNNNGECRKLAGGAMCPSYRATRHERDVTRGRANTLRLAISGQLGPDALGSDDVLEAMNLCVSCKACKRECPTGVDMARLKIEALVARNARKPLSLHERLIAYLPRYAPYAARFAGLLNARNTRPALARLGERVAGFAAARPLPRWRGRLFHMPEPASPKGTPRGEVALFADTFNTYFEPENLWDGVEVLVRLGYRVSLLSAGTGRRALCCGRTFLSAGLVDQARAEARRLVEAARPALAAGFPIVGLEPSCVLTLRDELLSLGLGDDAKKLAEGSFLIEEFLVREARAGRLSTPIGRLDGTVHLHTHCHQKAFGVTGEVTETLALVDGLAVKPIESGCCGMAGAFGYDAATHAVSLQMGELALLPAVRAAGPDDLIAADGFSCRHQIADGTSRAALHVARILRRALKDEAPKSERAVS